MLTNVVVGLPLAETPGFSIPVLTPGEDGLFISKVEGLMPVASNVVTKNYGIGDGEYYTGSHRGKRNIVLTIGMESRGIDIETARGLLYGHFYTQDSLKLRFEFDDRLDVEIIGYPETHESDRFVQDVEAQISIICPKPNFIESIQQTETGTSGVDPAMTDVVYAGDRSIGFLTQIILPDPEDDIEIGTLIVQTGIEGDTPGEYVTSRTLEIIVGDYGGTIGSIVAGDQLWIDSRQGLKSIYIFNPTTNVRRNAMKGMTEESQWPILHPGINKFRVSTPDVIRDWAIFYHHEFGGV